LAPLIHAAFCEATAAARPVASIMQDGSLIFWQPISPASLIALIMAFWRIRSEAVAAAAAIWPRM
jgi:hypothetical protein